MFNRFIICELNQLYKFKLYKIISLPSNVCERPFLPSSAVYVKFKSMRVCVCERERERER